MTDPMHPSDAPRRSAPSGRDRSSAGDRRAPLAVVAVVCLIPAVAFAGLWRWADQAATEPPPTTTTTVPAGPPVPELTTALASLRRTPAPLADEVAAAELVEHVAASLDPVEALDAADVSACATVTRQGEPIAAVNADLKVVPASNQKLLVAAVALDVLGADTTFVTEVRGAPVVDGVVAGDLYLVGGGDPLLQSADVVDDLPFPAFGTTSFDALADALVDAGVARVEGDIVGDGSRYDDEFIVPSWGDEITRRDGGPISALLVNDGRIFGSGYGLHPNQSAASELNRLLAARGVAIEGANRVDETPADGVEVLASVESVPVAEVVAEMLQTSDNNTAEMLLKEIGFVGAGEGSRYIGMTVVHQRLSEWGVPLADAVLDDGSGLSRANAVACEVFTALLAHVGDEGELAEALPVAGESGTLVEQLIDTPAEGSVAAKTGTLTGVKALSGFFPVDGQVFEFSVLLEGEDVDDPEVHVPVWVSIFDALASLPDEPDLDRFGPR